MMNAANLPGMQTGQTGEAVGRGRNQGCMEVVPCHLTELKLVVLEFPIVFQSTKLVREGWRGFESPEVEGAPKPESKD